MQQCGKNDCHMRKLNVSIDYILKKIVAIVFACAVMIFFMTSCAASLTDYGYKGGPTSTVVDLGGSGSFANMSIGSNFGERFYPEVVVKYPVPEPYKVDCKRYDFPVKKIRCKDGDNFEVKSYMIFQFDMKDVTYRNFTFQIDFIKAGTTDTVSTAKTSVPFIKGPIKSLRNLTELSCCRKKDKVLYVETKAEINPVYFDNSYVRFKKRFIKPMREK